MDVTKTEEYTIYKLIAAKLGVMYTNVSMNLQAGKEMEDTILEIVQTVYKGGYVDGMKEATRDITTIEEEIKENLSKIFN